MARLKREPLPSVRSILAGALADLAVRSRSRVDAPPSAIERNPFDKAVMFSYIRAYALPGEPDTALRLLRMAAANHPELPPYALNDADTTAIARQLLAALDSSVQAD